MRALLGWFRFHRKTSIALGAVAVLIAMHQTLSWHTEREWQRYCAEARARGVKLTFAELETAPIPDEENFAALPMFKAAFASAPGAAPRPFKLLTAGPKAPSLNEDLIKGKPFDWAVWQKLVKGAGLIDEITDDPVADVLRGLDTCAPRVAEWQQWRRLGQCEFPVEWKNGFATTMPHLAQLQDAAQFFALRARANLARHDSGAAVVDIEDQFQAYRAVVGEPMALGEAVRRGILLTCLRTIAIGLEQNGWVETELLRLDAMLATVQLEPDYRLAVSTERVFSNAFMEQILAASPGERAQMIARATQFGPGGPEAASPTLSDRLMGLSSSRRKVRRNQLRTNRYYDALAALPGSGAAGVAVIPRELPGTSVRFEAMERWQYYWFHEAPWGLLAGLLRRHFEALTMLHQTRIAIALERFRLARGAFPESLTELVPEFLREPLCDSWVNAAMKYHRMQNGSFHLYSVGKDGVDDGGVVDRKKAERDQRDAIWLYAPP